MKVSHVLGPLPSMSVAPSIWPKKDIMFKLYVLFLLLFVIGTQGINYHAGGGDLVANLLGHDRNNNYPLEQDETKR
jgi:hypothetical protein